MGFTPRTQAREIARFAIETRGLKRFAILHPRDRFGEEFSQAFWDAVEALGGEIVAYESYPPGETDFRQSIDRLSGLYYTEAREKELADLAEQRKALNITRKTRKTEMYFNLKPIVDYEAVFIPDEPKVVGQILPTFAYRDVPKVQFLGINTWNSPELFQRAQAWAAGSVFTEAFHPESGPAQARKFAARYRQTYDTDPGAIEALAFDAAAVVERVLSEGAITRAEVRDGLRAMNRFPGVTGELGWRPEGFTRRVSILGINRAGQITPAPSQLER
jgi:ABC-type branched-subunit amino acid transport system substrate-binding protein